MFVIAHISDLHFDGTREHRERVEAALRYINERADGIDALLVTGDITDSGEPEQYREAHEVLTSPIPMIVTAGNHDRRPEFNVGLLGRESDRPVNRTQRIGEVLVVVADSSVPGRSEGHLDDETLAWMAGAITAAGDETPVVVAFHHPPAPLEMPYMDRIRQTGADRLAAFVADHPNIVGLVCGHVHSPSVTIFAGRPLVMAPGVSSTLNLPFEGHGILAEGQPPGIAFHLVTDDADDTTAVGAGPWRMTSHFRAAVG